MLFRSPVVRFFSRILNRVTITVVLVALQLLWLCWVAFAITTGTGRVWVNGLLNALSLLIVLYLVRKDENSAYKVGWIALIGILPLLGGALYLAFGNKRPAKRLRLKMQAVEDAHKKDLVQEPGVLEGLDAREQGQSRYVAKYGPYPAWQNTRTQYFACGEAMYPQLLADLEKAEKSIFLEFFIVSHGCMWNGIEKILRRKAAQGVDVRLIYDDFGSLLGLPADFIVRMERAHIRCIPFNPVVPLLSLVMNHRDHRKIVVIDGKVAYTGGINLADEYINAITRFGYWKDAGLRIEGAAVWNFTVMFLDFWNAFRPFEQDYSAFRPQLAVLPDSDGVVQPYADSPLDEEPVAETVYLDILAQSQQYVYFYTPYLAIGEEMLDALRHPVQTVKIGLVGKYVELHDSYISVNEALKHGGIATHSAVDIHWIDSETLEGDDVDLDAILGDMDGILVPGGFGSRGIEGKINACRYARTHGVPYLGICLGMQIAIIEFARDVLGMADANSAEIDPSTTHPVIDILPEQKDVTDMGGTMRLGQYPCTLNPESKAYSLYGASMIYERHRHRYEVNNDYRPDLLNGGMIFAGTSPDNHIVEMVEIPDHPWFVAGQFHPEFKSRPNRPHPLFRGFVTAAAARMNSKK